MKLSVSGVEPIARMGLKRSFARQAALCGALAAAVVLLAVPMKAHAAEHALLGVKLFAPVKTVLDKYGNPTHILTGADILTGGSSTTTSGTPDGGPMPGMQPPSNQPPEFGGGAPNTGSANNGATTSGTTAPDTSSEVMYVYQKANGVTMQFLLSPDGRVIQITVLGYKSTAKTERNIMLGSGYSTVIGKYGYPESQTSTNGIVTMNYLQKQHVLFNVSKNKVVGITVAAQD